MRSLRTLQLCNVHNNNNFKVFFLCLSWHKRESERVLLFQPNSILYLRFNLIMECFSTIELIRNKILVILHEDGETKKK